MLSKNSEAYLMITSETVKPFWDEVERLRQKSLNKLIQDEDLTLAKAVKAIEEVQSLVGIRVRK